MAKKKKKQKTQEERFENLTEDQKMEILSSAAKLRKADKMKTRDRSDWKRNHERGLDQFIDEFRKQYTLDAEQPENTDENGERLDPRSLVNGEKIIKKYQQFDEDTDDFAQQIITDIGLDEPSHITSLQTEILSLLETSDAIGDVLIFEGYYQIMQGNALTPASQGVNIMSNIFVRPILAGVHKIATMAD